MVNSVTEFREEKTELLAGISPSLHTSNIYQYNILTEILNSGKKYFILNKESLK